MRTFLQIVGILMLVFVLTCLAAGVGLCLAGAASPHFGMHVTGASNVLGAALGLFIAAVAIVFALAVTAMALAGAFLAVVFALLLTGLILLAVALPFLLPLIIPLVLVLTIVLATRHSSRPRPA